MEINIKMCPHCHGVIKLNAIKCRHCKKSINLNKNSAPAATPPPLPAVNPANRFGSFYKPSGKVGWFRTLLSFVFLAPLILYPVGLLYNYFSAWMPFIYLNAVGTVVMGGAGAVAANIIMTTGKIRGLKGAIPLAFSVSFLAVYISWMTFVPARTEAGYEYMFVGIGDLLAMIPEWAETGTMKIKNFPVKGGWLYAVWVAEALIIAGISFIGTIFLYLNSIYCENCGKWFETVYNLRSTGKIPDHGQFKQRLAVFDFSCIAELGKGLLKSDHSVFEAQQCPACKGDVYLTVTDVRHKEKVTKTMDMNVKLSELHKGKKTEYKEDEFKEKVVIAQMLISNEHMEEIRKIIRKVRLPDKSDAADANTDEVIEAETVS